MPPLSINQKKLIRSLARKKDRKESGLFLVEGDKMVREILSPGTGSIPYRLEMVLGTAEWFEEFKGMVPDDLETIPVTLTELGQISIQQEPNRAIALAHQMDYLPDPDTILENLCLGMENIQDPGNLGTIIRIADWFGIRDILCSGECVELYNPKVIQASMGSFLRVRVHYTDLNERILMLREKENFPVFATGEQGRDLYRAELPEKGLILMGNESKGLSDAMMKIADQVLTIPFQDDQMHPESLNVAAATAILCAEFRRQGSLR